MKTNKIKYLSLLLIGLVFFSCESVDEDQIATKVPYITNLSTEITNTESKQRVLLEDYTGWRCVNCPRAAAKTEELIDKYGTSLVVMAVHATSFASPSPSNNNIDFRTPYGEEWAREFGCSSLPTGIINRMRIGGSYTIGDGSWDEEIENRLSSQEHRVDLFLGAKYREEENNIILSIEAHHLKDIDFSTSITAVIVESNIIGTQLNGNSDYGETPKIDDFEFNHVLRKKGIIDYPLSETSQGAGTKIDKNYLLEIDEDILDINNCDIIVFISNTNTREIIQVNQISL